MKTQEIPTATYRLQFTPQFTFLDALKILPYLRDLGISHIYASPVTRARKGSMHGYDVCDPGMVNPELGSMDQLETLLQEAARHQLGWIQDIVPNHMAYSSENPYMTDVLEHGTASRYADFFDITWDHPHDSLRGRVLAPFLGKPYGLCVVDGELKVVYENGRLWIAYYDHRFPLSPESYHMVLTEPADGLTVFPDQEGSAYAGLRTAVYTLDNLAGAADVRERADICTQAKSATHELQQLHPQVSRYLLARTSEFSTGTPEGNLRFDKLMSKQNFRLAFWKVAAEELNYRRFFTVSDLICIRAEREDVFDESHSLILPLADRGLIQGLRIDHIDGLFDPAAYLDKLRARAPGAYIAVEKILEKTENIPPQWPVQGSSGYDFLNHLGYVFCEGRSEKKFTRLYEKFIGRSINPAKLQIEKKRLIIGRHMAGDIDNLAHLIIRIAGVDLMARDVTPYGLRRALVEVLAHFPVYRTYITASSFSHDDAQCIRTALSASRGSRPGFTTEYDFIERFLMMQVGMEGEAGLDEAWRNAVMRFQQFTGPLMAKGCEDTFFYVYNRHAALNEVGGWPAMFGLPEREFHAFITKRLATHPQSMNATATHDTKRGEDTRARLQVLTEIPGEWEKNITAWAKLNRLHKNLKNGMPCPDPNDEYLFYQTVAGTLPFGGTVESIYIHRIRDYMIKAVREAKVHTAWIKPDEEYETAVTAFVENTLNPEKSPEFIRELRAFVRKLSWHGLLNSISQAILKSTLPGIPDFYQGTELWDLSLVDPDNRRDVDYAGREALLAHAADVSELLGSPSSGAVKQFAIRKCLAARREHAPLFERGAYERIPARGFHGRNVLAFSRRAGNLGLLVIVPRLSCRLVRTEEYPHGPDVWKDTRIRVSGMLRQKPLLNIFTGETLTAGEELHIGSALSTFPAAVFVTLPSSR